MVAKRTARARRGADDIIPGEALQKSAGWESMGSIPRRPEDEVANPLQERYAEVLLEKIRGDRHPSATHMNMFEAIAPPRQRLAYVLHLMEMIGSEQHPSIPMMKRVENQISAFGE